jgi:hypothetical protein
MTNIESKLFDEISKEGFADLDEDHYVKYNKEDLRIEDFIKLFFKRNKINNFIVESTEAFTSPGYDCEVVSIAWIEDNELQLTTILLEAM